MGACIPIPHFSLLIYKFPEDRIKIEGEEDSTRGQKGKRGSRACGKVGWQGWSLDVSLQLLSMGMAVPGEELGNARLPRKGARWGAHGEGMVGRESLLLPKESSSSLGEPGLGRATAGQRLLVLDVSGASLEHPGRRDRGRFSHGFSIWPQGSSCWGFSFLFLSWKLVKDSTEPGWSPVGK